MGMIDFNVNEYVYVKLNEKGLRILKNQHDELYEAIGKEHYYTPPAVDKDGFTRFQMHTLMNRFGSYMVMGAEMPFETTIRIDLKNET